MTIALCDENSSSQSGAISNSDSVKMISLHRSDKNIFKQHAYPKYVDIQLTEKLGEDKYRHYRSHLGQVKPLATGQNSWEISQKIAPFPSSFHKYFTKNMNV